MRVRKERSGRTIARIRYGRFRGGLKTRPLPQARRAFHWFTRLYAVAASRRDFRRRSLELPALDLRVQLIRGL